MRVSSWKLMFATVMLAPAAAIAQTADRVVQLSDDPVPEFLTPLNDDGFIDGRSDVIPELKEEAVAAFFGNRRQLVLYDGPLAEQLADALSGPPFDKIDLGNGYFVYIACKLQSCGERGAVIMDRASRIVAAELIGYRCRQEPEPGCDDTPVAHAFIEQAHEDDFAERVFSEWAVMSFREADEFNRDYFSNALPTERVLRVTEIRSPKALTDAIP